MRIVYIILAHKLPEQLVRLVKKLDAESSYFLIHVDKRTDSEIYRKMREPLSALRNVFFMDRLECNLGDFSLLKATLMGIEKLQALGLQFDYVFYLSGQDYPLKSNDYIKGFLKQRNGQSFMEYFPLPDDHWKSEEGGLNRVVKWHFYWRGRSYSIRKHSGSMISLTTFIEPILSIFLPTERRIPGNLKPFGGSAWWCLSRECIEYLGEIIRGDKRLVRFFHHVLVPVEIFYQTVLMNSPLKDMIVNDDLHYIIWPPTDSYHPLTLQKSDFERFIHTDKLFARKFDTTMDAGILDMIDKVIS